MLRSSPKSAFVKDDFPTLGRPTMAIRGMSACSIAFSSLGKIFIKASSRSPVPLPVIAEIGKTSPKPN